MRGYTECMQMIPESVVITRTDCELKGSTKPEFTPGNYTTLTDATAKTRGADASFLELIYKVDRSTVFAE